MTAEETLTALGLVLPPAPPRGGIYKPVVIVGNLAYVSGHGPYRADQTYLSGKVGVDLDLAEGKEAARLTGLALLATLQKELGSLNRIQRVVKLLGMVNAAPDFADHPKVINGCSELFAQVFGEDAGVGARSAVGMGSLPGGIPVEIELIVELKPA